MYDDMLMFNLTDIYLTLTHQTPGYSMDQETAGNIGLQKEMYIRDTAHLVKVTQKK